MKTIFDHLLKISNNYKETVDDLAQDCDLDGRRDYLYADEIKAQRVQERNSKFNKLVDRAAEEAAERAMPEIGKLRERLKQYVTSSSNPAAMQTLQALLAGGVELSSAELAAFAEGADYATLRLLEKPSGGHIQAPSLADMEKDVKELAAHFRSLRAYRGAIAGASTEIFWGMPAPVGSKIQEGMLTHFPEKLDAMQQRWAILER